MSAGDEMRREILKLEAMTKEVFVGVATEANRSIVEGSELTGAPGQPVDTGYEKGGFQLMFDSPTLAVIATNVAYAEVIEDNLRSSYNPDGVPRPKGLPGQGAGGRHIKSTVGGHHSVKMTVAGMPRIVADVVQRTVKGGGA